MKTILITAYAVNPYKGSEDGTGWNITKEIAKKHKVILITRKNNVPHLDKYKSEFSDEMMSNIDYYGFDLPEWVLKIKKKSGERGYVLYYYFWQLLVALFAKKKQFKFDIAHSLNFHSDSHPNFLWMLGKPTFWGPVGHHPKVPKSYILPIYGRKAYLKDRLYYAVKWCMRNLDPFYYLAVKKSEMIFGINSSVQTVMKAAEKKFTILPAVASPIVKTEKRTKSKFNVLSVGRFHYMKGFDVTIRSFAQFYRSLKDEQQKDVSLTLVGKGSEKDRLMKIAMDESISDVIKWVDWIPLEEMKNLYEEASVFLFPSHEGAGMVVPEAMSYGIPVLAFDNVGPGELIGDTGAKVRYSNYRRSVTNFSNGLMHFYKWRSSLPNIAVEAKKRHEELFVWDAKAAIILSEYEKVISKTEGAKTIAVFHPSSELYGADRILVNALNALPSKILKKVYLKFNGPLEQFILDNVENVDVQIKPNLPIIYRAIFTPRGVVKFVADWIKFLGFIRNENRKHKFTSAYVNTLSASLILPLLSFCKIPSFIHVHEIIESPKMIGKLTAAVCNTFSNNIVCVSQAVLNNLKKYAPSIEKKSITLHNGINKIESTPASEIGDLKFFLFGRLMPQKGQWYLLDALATIPKDVLANTKFILMGGVLDGHEDLLKDLTKKVSDLELGKYIEIREFAPNIADAMSEADVCLVPSMMKDPFPTTVLEAMSAGRPVIATNHGGAIEAISNGFNGLLVNPGDVGALAKHIQKLIHSRQYLKKLGTNAQAQFQKKFTINVFNQKWKKFNIANGFI